MPAFHCLALTNDEAYFAQDGYWVPVMANTRAPGNGPNNTPPEFIIDGEPYLLISTLDAWIHYREKLATLPQNDEYVRLAITVAEARISKLIRDARTRPWDC
jgi:hypothetical protein